MSDEVIVCPACKTKLESYASKCPACGASFAPPIKAAANIQPDPSMQLKMVEPPPLPEAPPIIPPGHQEVTPGKLQLAEPEPLPNIPPPLPTEPLARTEPSFDPPPEFDNLPEPKKSTNYFVRHWRGELPLARTYWVNGVALTLSVLFALKVIQQMQEGMNLKLIAAVSVVFSTLALVLAVWQFVGIWRSSTNYVCEGGALRWGVLAKVAVFFGAMNFLATFFGHYVPQSLEMIRIVAGDTQIPRYKISVMFQTNGTEVEFRGGMRAGCAKDLERTLSELGRVKVLHIESTGGRLNEARTMGQLVKKYGLITYTSEYCMSAATLVLIAGKERVVAGGARVGFHAGTLPGITPAQRREMDEAVRTSLKSAGVSEKFISRVLATSPKDMWFPTVAEMLKEGVITSESYGDRFANSWALSSTNLDATVSSLTNNSFFNSIHEIEPELYAKMAGEFTAALRAGKSEGEALGSILETCTTVMQKYLPSTSDEALLALRANWVSILKKYRQKNSRMCVAMFTSQKLNYSRAFPDWDATNSLRVIEKVIRSGAGRAPVKIDRNAALQDIQVVASPMTDFYGERGMELLRDESKWMDNSEKVCEMLQMMYEGIGSLPNKREANLLRYLLTVKDDK